MVADRVENWKDENLRTGDPLTDESLIDEHLKYIKEKIASAERDREIRMSQFEALSEEEAKVNDDGFEVSVSDAINNLPLIVMNQVEEP